MFNDYIKCIDNEIKWCDANSAPFGVDKDSFIRGLQQAQFLIRECAKAISKSVEAHNSTSTNKEMVHLLSELLEWCKPGSEIFTEKFNIYLKKVNVVLQQNH